VDAGSFGRLDTFEQRPLGSIDQTRRGAGWAIGVSPCLDISRAKPRALKESLRQPIEMA